ncbi:KAT8 regulatory NSL complex subunit 3-like isoform X2 [Xenia sp. Carnegie-2017]|uniref:KAT8 regulatory NSL complex subunit 3-like isoform X2 n=1 Tax=Xenia sp. Carnegie-2017 TaxID=2897299 RepID=UPI001F04EA3A|nr:KAT8 regulatory NSL complex subunit 3-like isoform X2 [Xenia sp. Carnegie-2017]
MVRKRKLPHARPAVNLFASQVAPVDGIEAEKSKKKNSDDAKNTKTEQEEEIIDVDSVEEPPPSGPGAINIQYDVVKSKIVMSECEKYVNSTSSKRTPDTWEELICRTGWTTQQNVLFDKILKIVSAYRLSWLTYKGSNNEPILRRIALDKATKKVRQILSRIEWVPTLVDKILAGGATHRRVSAGSTDNLAALLKRPWDATVALSSYQRPRKILGTPLLLIVPNGPTTNISGNSTKRSRFWHHHLSHFGKVIPVTMHLSNSGRGVSIGQCLDHMIGAVQAKVLELKNHFPNRPVILIGWATGALVSFQVSLRESVCAIVCLGFPMLTVDGIRGTADDPFLESKIPTLFVYGTLSTCCSLTDIEEFRSKLLADTSLLVVSGADGQLRLTSAKKKKEGVTQSVVDRRIMDDIGEFVNRAVSNMKDDTHPRLDYYDFDDFEIQRKKSKSVYRKRSSVDGQVLPSDPKKPRGRTTKAVNSEANSAKKAKPMKKPTVKKSLAHAPGTDGFGTVTSVPAVKPVSIPITSLHTVHPGVLQGVPLTSVSTPVVPISGVPVSRVSIPGVRISGLSIPVTGVNVPVSAVFKQGSLGGGSLVFSGATGVPGNPVGTTSGIKNMGGKTHLKIVVNPTSDAGIQLSGTPATTMISEAQAVLQYKNAIGASVSKSNAVCLIPTSSKSATGVATTTLTSTLVTSSPTTRPPMTSTALTSALIVSSGFISEPAPASNSTL